MIDNHVYGTFDKTARALDQRQYPQFALGFSKNVKQLPSQSKLFIWTQIDTERS